MKDRWPGYILRGAGARWNNKRAAVTEGEPFQTANIGTMEASGVQHAVVVLTERGSAGVFR